MHASHSLVSTSEVLLSKKALHKVRSGQLEVGRYTFKKTDLLTGGRSTVIDACLELIGATFDHQNVPLVVTDRMITTYRQIHRLHTSTKQRLSG